MAQWAESSPRPRPTRSVDLWRVIGRTTAVGRDGWPRPAAQTGLVERCGTLPIRSPRAVPWPPTVSMATRWVAMAGRSTNEGKATHRARNGKEGTGSGDGEGRTTVETVVVEGTCSTGVARGR
jgi:hypothetical protein